jgi:hypothetical protein
MVSIWNEPGESCPRHDQPVLVLPDGLEAPRERAWDLLESWRPNTGPASLGQMVEMEAELHRARIAILTAEAEDRERGAGAVLNRPMPPPLGR